MTHVWWIGSQHTKAGKLQKNKFKWTKFQVKEIDSVYKQGKKKTTMSRDFLINLKGDL